MGAALLHNARDADVEALFELPESEHGALYTLDDLHLFRRFLTSRFAPASGERAAQALAGARQEPLLKVTDVARQRSVTGGGLILLDEQYVAVDQITRYLKRAAPRSRLDIELFYDPGAVPSESRERGSSPSFPGPPNPTANACTSSGAAPAAARARWPWNCSVHSGSRAATSCSPAAPGRTRERCATS
jgi:hypothetical protein